MSNLYSRQNLENWLVRFLIAAPVSMLAVKALAWLRFGMDMPLWDDWEDFRTGDIGSFHLSYLFHIQNDTVSPVGRFFDSAAFHLLDSNVVAYQFLTHDKCSREILRPIAGLRPQPPQSRVSARVSSAPERNGGRDAS